MDIEIIGYVSGTLTTSCFIPQVWKVFSEKNCSGLSLPMYVMFVLGVSGWLVYGILLNSTPIILFNALPLLLTLMIIYKIIALKKAK